MWYNHMLLEQFVPYNSIIDLEIHIRIEIFSGTDQFENMLDIKVGKVSDSNYLVVWYTELLVWCDPSWDI